VIETHFGDRDTVHGHSIVISTNLKAYLFVDSRRREGTIAPVDRRPTACGGEIRFTLNRWIYSTNCGKVPGLDHRISYFEFQTIYISIESNDRWIVWKTMRREIRSYRGERIAYLDIEIAFRGETKERHPVLCSLILRENLSSIELTDSTRPSDWSTDHAMMRRPNSTNSQL